eukprot:1920458-Amphidinium_carterae.1
MGRETPRVEPLEDAQTVGSGNPDPGSGAAQAAEPKTVGKRAAAETPSGMSPAKKPVVSSETLVGETLVGETVVGETGSFPSHGVGSSFAVSGLPGGAVMDRPAAASKRTAETSLERLLDEEYPHLDEVMEPEPRAGQPMASGEPLPQAAQGAGSGDGMVGFGAVESHGNTQGVVEHVDADVHIMGLSMQDMHTRAQVIDEGWDCGTAEVGGPVPDEPVMPECWKRMLSDGGGCWDDVNGKWLPADLVWKARLEEQRWLEKEQVYKVVPREESRRAGIPPLDLLWVDTDKSADPSHLQIRSRLCVREYKTRVGGKVKRVLPDAQLFSAMPPLEALKLLCSLLVSLRTTSAGDPLKGRHYDIS